MGNFYTKPERKGNSPFTRSGAPPPPLVKKSGSDAPIHRIHDPMSLELHMADPRKRTAGLTDAEREWRRKWVLDQHLHPDEPIHVDAVHRQLNPIRTLYRYPLDTLYRRFLQPTFGTYYGGAIRIFTPKALFFLLFVDIMYYHYKYNVKGWQALNGIDSLPLRMLIDDELKVKQEYPGLVETGASDPAKYRYFHPEWAKRTAALNLDEPTRPW